MLKEGDLKFAKEIRIKGMIQGTPHDVKYIKDSGLWKAYTKKGNGWVVANTNTFNDLGLAYLLNKKMTTPHHEGQINIIDAYGNGFSNMVYGKTRVN